MVSDDEFNQMKTLVRILQENQSQLQQQLNEIAGKVGGSVRQLKKPPKKRD